MRVGEVKDVRWPNELLEYCELRNHKVPRRVGYITTNRADLPRCHPIKPVNSYLEVQELVSRLAALNGRYMLLLRGQSRQHFLHEWSADSHSDSFKTHSLRPGIWRLDGDERAKALERLLVTSEVICKRVDKRRGFESSIDTSLKSNPLAAWAIIQHYEDVLKCRTPMLDLTRSLHVACHFALQKNGHGYIYVIGSPWPVERFTTSIEDSLVVTTLLGSTPCSARRPLAQDGYLMCTTDYWKILAREDDDVISKMEGQYHNRILAVIEVQNSSGFWAGSPVHPVGDQYESGNDQFYSFLARTVLPEVERRMDPVL